MAKLTADEKFKNAMVKWNPDANSKPTFTPTVNNDINSVMDRWKPTYVEKVPLIKKPTYLDNVQSGNASLNLNDLIHSKDTSTLAKIGLAIPSLIGTATNAIVNNPIGSRFMGVAGGINDQGKPIKPVGSAGPIGNFLAEQAGGLANLKLQGGQTNLFAGGDMIANALPKATKLAQYGATALGQGANLGLYSGLDTGYKGGSNADVLKSIGGGALMGAGLGVAGKGLGELGKLAFPDWKTTQFETMKEAPMNDLGTNSNPIQLGGEIGKTQTKFKVKNLELEKATAAYDDAIQTIQNRFMTNKLTPEEMPLIKSELGIDLPKLIDDVGKAKTDVAKIAERQRLGAVAGVNEIPSNKLQTPLFKAKETLKSNKVMASKIETPSANTLSAPIVVNKPNSLNMSEVQGSGILKDSKFQNTIADSSLTNPKLKDTIKSDQYQYDSINNKDTIIQAQKIINADPIKAKEWVMSDEKGSATQYTTAQLLVKQAQNEGRFGDAVDMIQKVSEKATNQGQAIQALSLWNKLTPDGMLKFANQTIEKANLKLPEGKKVELTPELAQDITNRMTEINKMPEGTDKNIKTQKVLKDIANQVPVGFWKKVDTLQTISQLLNPKTSIRNVLGNTGMMLNENISNTLGAGIDKGVSLITGKRTVGLPNILEQAKGYKEGALKSINEVKNGVSLDNTQYDLPNSKIFSDKNIVGKTLNSSQKVLDYMLKTPDEAAKTAIRNDSLRSQMKLAKVNVPTDEMMQIAENDAKYGTFQDTNAVSSAFSSVKKSLNLNKDFGAGSLLLKYPKTPANILMRAIDYSPAGFFKSAYRLAEPLMKNGEFNQRDFVKSTSRALVGTGNLIGTGYIFSKLGIITGKSSLDYDTAAMQKMSGLGDYKLNLSALKRFVTSGFNTDSAKVQQGDNLINYDWLQPASIGLAIGANAADNKKNSGMDILSSAVDSINSGMNTLAQQPLISGLTKALGQRDASKAVTETIKGVPASMVPTILKQVAQVMDNTTRNTYDPSWVKQGENMVQSKLPGLTQSMQPKLDTFGQPQKAYENNNLANIFLNPAFTSKYDPNKSAEVPINIFNQTGATNAMPRATPNYIMNKGTKIQLTPQENTDYQRYVGQKTEQALKSFENSPANEKTAKTIQNILTKINAEGKDIILKNRGLK